MPSPTRAVDRIQLSAEGLGEVMPYRSHVTREFPSAGWYFTPAAAADGCDCDFCVAARAGRHVHLAGVERFAIERLLGYARDHVGLLEPAPS